MALLVDKETEKDLNERLEEFLQFGMILNYMYDIDKTTVEKPVKDVVSKQTMNKFTYNPDYDYIEDLNMQVNIKETYFDEDGEVESVYETVEYIDGYKINYDNNDYLYYNILNTGYELVSVSYNKQSDGTFKKSYYSVYSIYDYDLLLFDYYLPSQPDYPVYDPPNPPNPPDPPNPPVTWDAEIVEYFVKAILFSLTR